MSFNQVEAIAFMHKFFRQISSVYLLFVLIAAPVHAEWVLDWSEECNGTQIDPQVLRAQVGWHGPVNGELQFYTDRPENFHLEDGECVFTAREERYADKQYTSARITTKGKKMWTYGAFEARISWPYGQGFFPAFWLVGPEWPGQGEIDVFEARGQRADEAFATLRGPLKNGQPGIATKSTTFYADQIAERMHVYRVEWEPQEIRFLFDGKLTSRWTPDSYSGEWAFKYPMFIVVNLAIGTDLVGAPDLSTFFPSSMYMDYLRVYRWEEKE